MIADPVAILVLGRAVAIRHGPQNEFQDHEDHHDPDGQADPTEGTKDFVAHVMSPRIERTVRPADSSRPRGETDRCFTQGYCKEPFRMILFHS